MTFYKFKETEQKGPSQVLNTGPSRCDATCAECCLIQSNPNAFLGFWDIIIGSSHFFVWHFITQTKNNELKKKETSRLIWIKTLISFSLTIRGHTKNYDKFLLWVFVFIYLFFMMYQLMRTQIQIQKRGRFKKNWRPKVWNGLFTVLQGRRRKVHKSRDNKTEITQWQTQQTREPRGNTGRNTDEPAKTDEKTGLNTHSDELMPHRWGAKKGRKNRQREEVESETTK